MLLSENSIVLWFCGAIIDNYLDKWLFFTITWDLVIKIILELFVIELRMSLVGSNFLRLGCGANWYTLSHNLMMMDSAVE
jgi:hypothetical protein